MRFQQLCFACVFWILVVGCRGPNKHVDNVDPNVTMGISSPDQCYVASAEGTAISFRIEKVSSPRPTDSALSISVSDPDLLAPHDDTEDNIQLSDTEQDIAFDIDIEDSDLAVQLVRRGKLRVVITAKSAGDEFTGEFEEPCREE